MNPPPGCYESWLYLSGWQAPVLVADVIILLAYTWISIRLLALKAHLRLLGLAIWPINGFALFVAWCGLTHGMTAARTRWALFVLSAVVTIITAVVSAGVAIAFGPLVSRLGEVIGRFARHEAASAAQPASAPLTAAALLSTAQNDHERVRAFRSAWEQARHGSGG